MMAAALPKSAIARSFTTLSMRARSIGSLIAAAIARVVATSVSIPGLVSASLSSASVADSKASTPGSFSKSNITVLGMSGSFAGVPTASNLNWC